MGKSDALLQHEYRERLKAKHAARDARLAELEREVRELRAAQARSSITVPDPAKPKGYRLVVGSSEEEAEAMS